MNYYRIYKNLIYKRKIIEPLEKSKELYTEHHHILPQCLFPQYMNLKEHSWNGVRLTAREHFIAHQLLIKIYNHTGLIFSVFKMSVTNKTNKINSKKYQWLKEKFSIIMKEIASNRKGRKHSEETKKKMSAASLGKPKSEDMKNKISKANKGRKHSNKSKENMSNSKKGKKRNKETVDKIALANTGKKRTLEQRQRMSEAHKSKVRNLKT